jgi:DNA-binding GntR family transcriptional regulator
MLSPKTQTKTEAAFSALRGAIENGDLPPGDRLRTNQLVEQLKMSPTPIREALRLLQAEGLVEYHAHQGMVVAEYSPESVTEVYRMRALMEPLAVELAVERATDDQIAEMRAAHDALTAALAGHSIGPDLASLNAVWHRAVYAPADSRLLIDFIARLWSAVPVTAFWATKRSKASLAQHAYIMEAIEARDAQAASARMREHIEDGARTTLEGLRARGHGSGRRRSRKASDQED